jgi:hypothetical protein
MQHMASPRPCVSAVSSRGLCVRGRCAGAVRGQPARVVAHAHPAEAQSGAAQGQGQGHGHGHGHGGAPATGFIAEMRTVAMKLHTKEQAPKEGEAPRKAESKPMPQVSTPGLRGGVAEAWTRFAVALRRLAGSGL